MCIFEKGYIMTNFVKKATAFFLAVAILFSLAIISHGAEGTVSINDDAVFLKQQTRVTCTLVSALMLFRRGAIINGNPNWTSFTENTYRKSKWWPSGLAWNISAEGMTASHHNLSEYGLKMGDLDAKRAWFIDMLKKHPEGIMAYCSYSRNNAHAVLLTDYDVLTDTFYCADPSYVIANGRIPLGTSELPSHVKKAGYGKNGMSDQDYVISYINEIWLIESGIDYSKSYSVAASEIESGLNETWVTNTGDVCLRIRSGPSTVCQKVGELAHGTAVTVTEKYNGWGHINHGGVGGWISLEYAAQVDPNQIIATVDSLNSSVFGKLVNMDAAPLLINDRVMLPVRFISEALGAAVTWDAELQMVKVTHGETVLTMHIGSDTAFIGESEVILDSLPVHVDGTAYAPVRFVAEALGATVSYDAEAKQITIAKTGQEQNS